MKLSSCLSLPSQLFIVLCWLSTCSSRVVGDVKLMAVDVENTENEQLDDGTETEAALVYGTIGHYHEEYQWHKVHSRQKRGLKNIDDMLKKAYKNPGLKGSIVYTARRFGRVDFDFDYGLLQNSRILGAELKLFKSPKKSKKNKKSSRRKRRRGGRRSRSVDQARVSIHQIITAGRDYGSTKMLDSKVVKVDERGWLTFDVTPAVMAWIHQPQTYKGFEVWIESVKSGKRAARVARRVRFVKASSQDNRYHPALAIYFKKGVEQ